MNAISHEPMMLMSRNFVCEHLHVPHWPLIDGVRHVCFLPHRQLCNFSIIVHSNYPDTGLQCYFNKISHYYLLLFIVIEDN